MLQCGIHTITEKITEIVLGERKLFTKLYKGYNRILNRLKSIPQPLLFDVILFCLDVKTLHPSFFPKETRIACRTSLDIRNHPETPTEKVLQLVHTVPENNRESVHPNRRYHSWLQAGYQVR